MEDGKVQTSPAEITSEQQPVPVVQPTISTPVKKNNNTLVWIVCGILLLLFVTAVVILAGIMLFKVTPGAPVTDNTDENATQTPAPTKEEQKSGLAVVGKVKENYLFQDVAKGDEKVYYTYENKFYVYNVTSGENTALSGISYAIAGTGSDSGSTLPIISPDQKMMLVIDDNKATVYDLINNTKATPNIPQPVSGTSEVMTSGFSINSDKIMFDVNCQEMSPDDSNQAVCDSDFKNNHAGLYVYEIGTGKMTRVMASGGYAADEYFDRSWSPEYNNEFLFDTESEGSGDVLTRKELKSLNVDNGMINTLKTLTVFKNSEYKSVSFADVDSKGNILWTESSGSKGTVLHLNNKQITASSDMTDIQFPQFLHGDQTKVMYSNYNSPSQGVYLTILDLNSGVSLYSGNLSGVSSTLGNVMQQGSHYLVCPSFTTKSTRLWDINTQTFTNEIPLKFTTKSNDQTILPEIITQGLY